MSWIDFLYVVTGFVVFMLSVVVLAQSDESTSPREGGPPEDAAARQRRRRILRRVWLASVLLLACLSIVSLLGEL